MRSESKKTKSPAGIILLSIILIILMTIIIAPFFFKNDAKIKIAFKNGQVISLLLLSQNNKNEVNSASVFFFNSKTNRLLTVTFLPETFLNFGNKYGYLTLKESIIKKIPKDILLNSIGRLVNTQIDYLVIVEKNTLISFIDLIGGVDIFTDGIKDEVNKVRIPEGSITLDGDKSLEYLSYINAKDSPDYNHAKRILNFIRGVVQSKNFFNTFITEDLITNLIYNQLKTNLTLSEFLFIYNEFITRGKNNNFDLSKGLEQIVVYSEKEYKAGYDFVLIPKNNSSWMRMQVKEALANIDKEFDKDLGGRPSIEIQNGTEIVGFATRTRSYLTPFGIDVMSIGNADKIYDNTIVLIGNSEQKARKIASLIKCQRLIKGDISPEKQLDAILIIGNDFDGKFVK